MSFCHRLALVGCGGMGRRHLRGYRVLLDFEPDRLEVSAVVDPELERAEFVAGEAEELFGTRPLPSTDRLKTLFQARQTFR